MTHNVIYAAVVAPIINTNESITSFAICTKIRAMRKHLLKLMNPLLNVTTRNSPCWCRVRCVNGND
ncbi:MAG: hypothetical protein FWG83_04470 [Oscillospiraceae bacterium]|nr:hypothetical protein [Oscillospiraceae bacterium]